MEEDHPGADRPDTRTFFKPEYIRQLARVTRRSMRISPVRQSYPMWDELAVAVWLDPSIVTRSATLLVDVDTSFTAGYGNTLSWSPGAGPGLASAQCWCAGRGGTEFERMTWIC